MTVDMTTPPVWLLDFDGVINAVSPAWGVKTVRRWSPPSKFALGKTYRVRWAQPLIDRIRQVHESGLAEVRWCSTWNMDTDALAEMTGLVFPASFPLEPNLHWTLVSGRKRLAAQAVLEREGRRLIWTDDVEVPFTWELAYSTVTEGGRALLIRPKERVGLTPAHMDQIDRYIGRVPASEEVAA